MASSLQPSLSPSFSPSFSPSVSRASSVSGRVPAPEIDHVKSGRAWAREVREAWEPLILTLDGGGIRGYSSLLILQALMHEVYLWERKLDETDPIPNSIWRTLTEDELQPCHYFDFMYGTSTGGLIATMLGRLRMTVRDCLTIYRQVGEDLFGHKRNVIPLATKYHHKPLEKAVQNIVKSKCTLHKDCEGLDWHPWHMDGGETAHYDSEDKHQRICQSVCLTATHGNSISAAHLLRTYDHHYPERPPPWIIPYNAGADKLRIWEVTRATSAAPFYFKMLEAELEGGVKAFRDGGIRENNPSGAAWSEFISLYGMEAYHRGEANATPALLLSNVLIKYTDGEKQHDRMLAEAKGEGENTWYKRLNVSTGLEHMKLDDWVKGPWRDPAAAEDRYVPGTVPLLSVELGKPPTNALRSEPSIVPGGQSLTRMEKVTKEYLERDFDGRFDTYAPPKVMLEQAAEKLVRHRRARERTRTEKPGRWNTFMGDHLIGNHVHVNGNGNSNGMAS
ncbi:hypothetical protein B0A49_06322 [Cryomyces minteri]|uniref:PNPLA domain-containing protein n=1 Tax=Cryomyces minteri TaxID=331657 RepID=A0A4U0WKZ2_9PEZI|nr:hypothetical protein B0A49_06322 [Cryomyces minteri]